jgi:AP-1 complex subunit beta-1
MSVLRADKILDYLASPLSKCLKDENPYVRKTAALCVAKVFDIKPELCVEYGFIDTLKDLIGDGNPMVSYAAPGMVDRADDRSSRMQSPP